MNYSSLLDMVITQTEPQDFNWDEFEKNIRSALLIIEGMKNNEQTKEYTQRIINDTIIKDLPFEFNYIYNCEYIKMGEPIQTTISLPIINYYCD